MGKSSEDIRHGLVVHLIGAVEDIAWQGKCSSKILCGLCFARSCRTGRRSSQEEPQPHGERHVAAIGERGDHKTACVSDPLVEILGAEVADSNLRVQGRGQPIESQLLLPQEGVHSFDFLVNQLLNNISSVYIERNNRDNLDSIALNKNSIISITQKPLFPSYLSELAENKLNQFLQTDVANVQVSFYSIL